MSSQQGLRSRHKQQKIKEKLERDTVFTMPLGTTSEPIRHPLVSFNSRNPSFAIYQLTK